jgi:hypothetical protein
MDVRVFMFCGGYYEDWFILAYHVLVYVSEEPTASIIKVEKYAKQYEIHFVFIDINIFNVMNMAKLKLKCMQLSPS